MNTLITGISSGIGLSTARRLARHDFKVFGTVRSMDKHRELISGLKVEYGDRIEIIPMDVTSDDSVKEGVKVILSKVGYLDSLICNAGIIVLGSIEEVPFEVLKQQYDVNLFGVLRTVKAVLPGMRQRHSGRIILVSSLASLAAIPFAVNYSASKCAIDAISEGLRQELKPFGIKVSSVRPGDFHSRMYDNSIQILPETSPYGPWAKAAYRVLVDFMENGPSPEPVARRIHGILKTDDPKTYYAAALGIQRLFPLIGKLTNSSIKERLIRLFYDLDKV